MARKYSDWIYITVGLALLFGTVAITGTTEWTAKRVLIKGCDYWEGKGLSEWCEDPLINQLEVIKCDKQLYRIKTHNNYCSDLIVTGGGGKRYYTKFAYNWVDATQEKCGIKPHELKMKGFCAR